MHQTLEDLAGQFTAVTTAVDRAFGSLDRTTMARRPTAQAWSPAECLTHLVLTTDELLPRIDAVLGTGSSEPGRPARRYRSSFVGWLLARSLEPPVRSRFKTTPAFIPDASRPSGEVLEDFRRSQRDVLACLARADGHDLTRLRVQSPFSARIRYNVVAAFRILAAHQRRHVWQAERALLADALPAS